MKYSLAKNLTEEYNALVKTEWSTISLPVGDEVLVCQQAQGVCEVFRVRGTGAVFVHGPGQRQPELLGDEVRLASSKQKPKLLN